MTKPKLPRVSALPVPEEKARRKRGLCGSCGAPNALVRPRHFWCTGLRMHLCADCERQFVLSTGLPKELNSVRDLNYVPNMIVAQLPGMQDTYMVQAGAERGIVLRTVDLPKLKAWAAYKVKCGKRQLTKPRFVRVGRYLTKDLACEGLYKQLIRK